MLIPHKSAPFPGVLRGQDFENLIDYFNKYYPKLADFYQASLENAEFWKRYWQGELDGFLTEYVQVRKGRYTIDRRPDYMLKDAEGHYKDAIRVWGLLERKVMNGATLGKMSLWYRWEQSEIRRKERKLWEIAPGQEPPWWRHGSPPPDELTDPEAPLLRTDRARVNASKMCGWHKCLRGYYRRKVFVVPGPSCE